MKIALVSYGSLFLDILEEFEKQGHQVVGYLGPNEESKSPVPYLGDDRTDLPDDVRLFITVGGIGKSIGLRTKLFEIHKEKLTNLIYSTAHVSRYATIRQDSGIMIMAQSVVRSNCVLEENTFINGLCNLGHDVIIGQNSQISNGVLIGGSTIIGKNCYIGQGANIFQGLSIGDNCIIGANALITKDVPAGAFVINKDQIKSIVQK